MIIVPADEFENEADLIRRVESLLEKTTEKKRTNLKTNNTVKTIIKYVDDEKKENVNKADQSSFKPKVQPRKHLLNDLKT